MLKQYFILLFSLTAVIGWSQQSSNYGLYMMNNFNWNPAFAGMDESLSITGGVREQWTGLQAVGSDANVGPSTQFVNAHLPVDLLRGGFGIQLENDALGPEKNMYFGAAYNFQTYLGPGILSIGIGGGFFQKELDGSVLLTPDGNYSQGNIDHQDVLLPITSVSANAPTTRLGLYYKSEWFEAGISAVHLNEPEVDLGPLAVALVRTYYLGAALHLNINDAIQFHPSFLVKSDTNQTQTELSGLVERNQNLFIGGAVRGYNTNSLDAATVLGGFKVGKKITIGYAYDITLSNLQNVSNGSHELVLNYNLQTILDWGRPPKVIFNPRNL